MSLTREEKRVLRLERSRLLDDLNWSNDPMKKARIEAINRLLCPNEYQNHILRQFTYEQYQNLLRGGCTNNMIASQLGVSSESLRSWVRRQKRLRNEWFQCLGE